MDETNLEHYGVKGMKWGQRKARRAAEKQAKSDFYQNKANNILKAALKDTPENPRTLVNLNGRLVITGKQFVDHMSAGGLMDIRRTEIWATREGSGPFEAQQRVGSYRR